MKKTILLSLVLAGAVAWLVTIGLNTVLEKVHFPSKPHPPIIIPPTAKGSHPVAGKPTLSVTQMNDILSAHNSPFAGHGQQIHDMGLKYGIDPAYALAFFMHESGLGTLGWAKKTKNPGNLRGKGIGGWTYFDNWDDGIDAWFRLIKHSYVDGGLNFTNPDGYTCSNSKPCRTVEQIIPVYAPSSDGNNVNAYIASVSHTVDVWRSRPGAWPDLALLEDIQRTRDAYSQRMISGQNPSASAVTTDQSEPSTLVAYRRRSFGISPEPEGIGSSSL